MSTRMRVRAPGARRCTTVRASSCTAASVWPRGPMSMPRSSPVTTISTVSSSMSRRSMSNLAPNCRAAPRRTPRPALPRRCRGQPRACQFLPVTPEPPVATVDLPWRGLTPGPAGARRPLGPPLGRVAAVARLRPRSRDAVPAQQPSRPQPRPRAEAASRRRTRRRRPPTAAGPAAPPPLRLRSRRSVLGRAAVGTTRARTRACDRSRPNRPALGSSSTSNSASLSSTPSWSSAISLASSTVFAVTSTHSTRHDSFLEEPPDDPFVGGRPLGRAAGGGRLALASTIRQATP